VGECPRKIAVGFEMLNQTLQPVLDDYAAGRITEEEFLTRADWKKEWGFDFAMYKPLFDFIVTNKLRALALNVPRKVVGKVARTGLASLTPEEKAFLPEKVEITGHKKYNEYLKATFGAHGDSPMAKMFTVENYLASMAAWNWPWPCRDSPSLNFASRACSLSGCSWMMVCRFWRSKAVRHSSDRALARSSSALRGYSSSSCRYCSSAIL